EAGRAPGVAPIGPGALAEAGVGAAVVGRRRAIESAVGRAAAHETIVLIEGDQARARRGTVVGAGEGTVEVTDGVSAAGVEGVGAPGLRAVAAGKLCRRDGAGLDAAVRERRRAALQGGAWV